MVEPEDGEEPAPPDPAQLKQQAMQEAMAELEVELKEAELAKAKAEAAKAEAEAAIAEAEAIEKANYKPEAEPQKEN